MVSRKGAPSAQGLIRTIFYLSPEERDAVAALALADRVSESEIYRRAIAEYLERQAGGKT